MADATLTVNIADSEIVKEAMTEAARLLEQARRLACSLESELAEQTDRIAEALKWLAVAATFSTSEDCSAAIDDARTALEVTS